MRETFIQEQLNPNIKNALYSNFSNAYEAIQEIVDNSVGHRIPGKKLQIKIFFITKPKAIEIQDIGGSGMKLKDLEFFFNWGGAKERTNYDIGLYSQGGKSAMGYLGNSFNLVTSPDLSMSPQEGNFEYRLEDTDLRDTSQLKRYRVGRLDSAFQGGYTSIKIENLKINVSENFKGKIKELLINTYRPLLERGEVELIIDDVLAQVPVFPLDSTFQIKEINSKILDKKLIKGWIGRLAPRSHLKGGIRCYYKGRLICEREFFGHPDPSYKGTLNFLIGEVYLDFVPVNTNKTDFKRDLREWEAVEETMNSILKPDIDELLGRTMEEPTEEELERVKRTRDLFQEILKLMKKKDTTPFLLEGEDYGQKPPTSGDSHSRESGSTKSRKKYEAATPPPQNSIGIRRRLRQFMNWDARPMDESIRSKIEEKGGGKMLIINNVYPAFKQSKGNDFYLLETAALQTVPIEDATLTPKKYLEEFDQFFGKICENMNEAKEILQEKRK